MEKVFYSILLFLLSFSAVCQTDSSYVRTDRPKKEIEDEDKNKQPFKEKIFVGLYPGFSWSSYGFSYEVSPLVGVEIVPRLSLGVGGVYKHSKSDGYYTSSGIVLPYTADFIGVRTFSYYDVYKNFCAYAEYEGVSIQYKNELGYHKLWQPAVKLGLLYKSPIGDRVAASLLVLYNVMYDDYETIGGSPLDIRVGFIFYPFRSKSY